MSKNQTVIDTKGETPGEGFPTPKQPGGLFGLPFLRFASDFKTLGLCPRPRKLLEKLDQNFI